MSTLFIVRGLIFLPKNIKKNHSDLTNKYLGLGKINHLFNKKQL